MGSGKGVSNASGSRRGCSHSCTYTRLACQGLEVVGSNSTATTNEDGVPRSTARQRAMPQVPQHPPAPCTHRTKLRMAVLGFRVTGAPSSGSSPAALAACG